MADIEFKDNSGNIIQATKKKKEAVLESWGMMGESFAKEETPVETSRLKNSIAHTVDDNFSIVGTNVEYAEPVEYDEKANHPRGGNAHYLRNAVTQHNDEYKKKAEMILGELK